MKAPSAVVEPIHARAMVYVGHAYSPWGAGHGKRTYTERHLKDGQVELVCGRGLDDAHNAAKSSGVGELFPWATLRSKKSRDARHVTCPECIRRIRAAGFVHAPEVSP
jgi:hypothetical protein